MVSHMTPRVTSRERINTASLGFLPSSSAGFLYCYQVPDLAQEMVQASLRVDLLPSVNNEDHPHNMSTDQPVLYGSFVEVFRFCQVEVSQSSPDSDPHKLLL